MIRDSSGMLNAYSGTGMVDPSIKEMIGRRGALLGPAYRLFYESPIHMVRGEGPWVVRRGWQALPRCLQQRGVCWALPSAYCRSDREPGGSAEHAHPLSGRHDTGLC